MKKVGKITKTRAGEDTEGRTYSSIDELWKSEFGDADDNSVQEKKHEWYKKGVDYWSSVEPTTQGVLGGFGRISDIDVRGSKAFLQSLGIVNFQGNAADCGAGIGRTSKSLLCPLFKSVDMIEPTPSFVKKAREDLAGIKTMNRFYQVGLEGWKYVIHCLAICVYGWRFHEAVHNVFPCSPLLSYLHHKLPPLLSY